MCGIVGFSGDIAYKQEIVNNMMDLMIHRGPNSAGSYTDGEMALGFRRLSIIDLADGSQPMYNEDKSLVLVFNGEIYNFECRNYLLLCIENYEIGVLTHYLADYLLLGGVTHVVIAGNGELGNSVKAGLTYANDLGTDKMLTEKHTEHGGFKGIFLLPIRELKPRCIGTNVKHQTAR